MRRQVASTVLSLAFIGTRIFGAQQAFKFREHLFDGVQIGRVGRQEEQPDACRLEHLADTAALMAAEIVEDDDAARLQFRDQELRGPCGEALTSDRAVKHARGNDAVMAQPGDEGQRFPVAMRRLAGQRLALRAPAVGARHVGLGPYLYLNLQGFRR